ncbi:thermonuclease family protein [Corynebacterium meitnerae]|uniref:Thermonuclease family protein n=1 Tax=Corynebacterium meitnerae TaxID=2913498 RepID=A0A9X3RIG4_9CORY|nr:thermonuclease family protein [Corynebacterium meitnerae]MCZ9293359.1 thermonuclease family protein [Corynebacterium meitnerae]
MKKWLVAVAAAALVGTGVMVADVMRGDTTVDRIIDGDTIDVTMKGETKRVRLLNIDTPELGRDGVSDECFAREAKARLEELLPVGTKVSLEYDVERQDRYGRELAGVFKEATFINEVIVQEGYARAVVFEPNRKFYDRILAAEAGPKHKKSGIFGAGGGLFRAGPAGQREAGSSAAGFRKLG